MSVGGRARRWNCRSATGDPEGDVIIGVAAPDAKTWWRNFLGDGGRIELLGLDGRDRIAHAVANRDGQGRVSVTVTVS